MRPPALLRVDVNQKDRCACALRKWITWWRAPGYSTVAGIFKQYELVCIVGDERDLLRVRTTYRRPREDVYVYRIRAPRENIRRAFLQSGRAGVVAEDPLQWLRPRLPLRGRAPRHRTPFAELERLSLVNARAHAADGDPAFSQRIRVAVTP